jgi:hypothetical protein
MKTATKTKKPARRGSDNMRSGAGWRLQKSGRTFAGTLIGTSRRRLGIANYTEGLTVNWRDNPWFSERQEAALGLPPRFRRA